jgi:hypothetical protein
MSADTVLVSVDAAVASVTRNRPDKRNALTPAMQDRLTEIIGRCDARPDVRVIMLTGAGTPSAPPMWSSQRGLARQVVPAGRPADRPSGADRCEGAGDRNLDTRRRPDLRPSTALRRDHPCNRSVVSSPGSTLTAAHVS